jgi:O-antigen/teichoic acid export membrane protein
MTHSTSPAVAGSTQVKAASTLRSRLLKAGSWSFAGHVLAQVIRFASNVLLAKFLMPEAFALTTIVLLLTIGLALFSDLGILQNVVRHPNGEDRTFLNTAWTVQIVRGFVIWLCALAVAYALPWAVAWGWVKSGTVYADPLLPWVIAVATFSAVFQGAESSKVMVERRNMRLGRLTQIELASQLVAALIMVLLAWQTKSIWALVAGGLISAGLRTLLTHVAIPGPANRLAWDRQVLRELLGFGKWVFLSSILFYLVTNSDRLILSNLIDAPTFGLYTIAFLLVTAPGHVVSTVAGGVALPALSEVVRDRPHDLARVTNRFQLLSDLFLMPMVGLLVVSGSHIVSLFYDARYQAAGPILSMLALGAMASRYLIMEQCYLALDRPQVFSLVNVIRFVFSYVGIPMAFQWGGFQGALIGIVLAQYSGWPVAFYFKVKYRLFSWRAELLGLPLLALGGVAGWLLNLVVQAMGRGAV